MQCYQCGTITNGPGKRHHDPATARLSEYARYCYDCYNGLKNPIKVIGANGSECEQTTGMCSCCGLSAGFNRADGWAVFEAGWCDEDGIFFARLCGYRDGGGCIEEVKPAGINTGLGLLAQAVTDLLGDDTDSFDGEDLNDYID